MNNPNFSSRQTPAITSDGIDDYIDTGVIPDNTTEVECLFRFNDYVNFQKLFGTRTSTPSLDAFFFGVSNGLYYGMLGGEVGYSSESVNNFDVVKVKISTKTQQMIINDVIEHNYINNVANNINTSMFIFAESDIDSQNHSNSTVFYCKIWKGDELIRHFVPQFNGTMIDLVHGVEYGNDGTGDLIYSNEPYELSDPSKILSLRGGDRDLTGKNEIENNGCIVGDSIVCNYPHDGITINSNPLDNLDEFSISTVISINTPFEGTYSYVFSNNNKVLLFLSTNYIYFTTNSYPANAYLWELDKTYHITCIRKSGVNYLYIDGILGSSTSQLNQPSNSPDMTIGDTNAVANRGFNGTIHKFEIYNEAKSAEWVKLDYEKEKRFYDI